MSFVSVISYPSSIIRPFVIKGKLNLRFVWIFLFGLSFSLLVFYIFQVNSLTGETYAVKNYQAKITQLTQENKNLEITFSKTSSLSNLENYLKNQNFEKISQVKYIQILESQVVKK